MCVILTVQLLIPLIKRNICLRPEAHYWTKIISLNQPSKILYWYAKLCVSTLGRRPWKTWIRIRNSAFLGLRAWSTHISIWKRLCPRIEPLLIISLVNKKELLWSESSDKLYVYRKQCFLGLRQRAMCISTQNSACLGLKCWHRVFGWRQGRLWVLDNAQDHWQSVTDWLLASSHAETTGGHPPPR